MFLVPPDCPVFGWEWISCKLGLPPCDGVLSTLEGVLSTLEGVLSTLEGEPLEGE
jgi:hypothetical protein